MGVPLKIVWLCTFSNARKRSHLKLWHQGRGEFGQWIPNLLEGMKDDAAFELHVISTEGYLKVPAQNWQEDSIYYHCFKSGVPVLGRVWPARIPVEHATKFWMNRRRIRKIVDTIKPDLIHLFGAENPQYGAGALDLMDAYPMLITIQGFIHRELQFHNDFYTRVRCRYEESLLKACHNFTGDYDSEQVVRKFNPHANYRHTYFPVNEKLIAELGKCDTKRYDLIFAGGLTKQKGFGDFLEVVKSLACRKPDLKAAVVGRIESYSPAGAFIADNKLAGNIVWLSRFPSQQGLFDAFRHAKLFLAPTYNDCFPSTIRENMLLGTPVIAYATGGIPWTNRDGGENAVIVQQGDVQGMADAAFRLLTDESSLAAMAVRAENFAKQEFSLQANIETIKRAYLDIVGAR